MVHVHSCRPPQRKAPAAARQPLDGTLSVVVPSSSNAADEEDEATQAQLTSELVNMDQRVRQLVGQFHLPAGYTYNYIIAGPEWAGIDLASALLSPTCQPPAQAVPVPMGGLGGATATAANREAIRRRLMSSS